MDLPTLTRERAIEAIEKMKGNNKQAADRLGLSDKTLRDFLKKTADEDENFAQSLKNLGWPRPRGKPRS